MNYVCMNGTSGKARISVVCVLCNAAFKLAAIPLSQGGLCFLPRSVAHTLC